MAEGMQDLVGVQETLFDEHVCEAFVALGLTDSGALELFRRESGFANQDLAQIEALVEPPVGRRSAHCASSRRTVTDD